MAKILFCILLAAFTLLVLAKMTDRICDKKYSKEFMQTEQYKSMQCPQK